jgi:hypothetical protein
MSQYVKEDDVATIAYMMGMESGKDYERAKIVAWLREQNGHGYDDVRANCIEAGEHLK